MAMEVQDSFRMLEAGMASGKVDETATVKVSLDAYKGVTETSWRLLGWLLLDLAQLAAGDSILALHDAPTTGTLAQQLCASDEAAAKEFGAAVDSDLRNAVAHSQYVWNEEVECVEDLKTQRRWEPGTLERLTTALTSATAGVDGAWTCFAIAHDIDVDPTTSDSRTPQATRFQIRLFCSSYGVAVRGVRDGGATILIEPPVEVDSIRHASPLAAISHLVPGAERYQMISADDEALVIAVSAEAARKAHDAPSELKDLANLELVLDAMLLSGRDRTESTLVIGRLMAKVVAVTGYQDLAEGQQLAGLPTLERRVRHVLAVVDAPAREHRELLKVSEKLGRVIDSCELASRDRDALLRLGDQLLGLIAWADKRGLEWPPRLA